MKIYAHRGFSGQYPENTMEAFLQVLKTPAEGIELDVQLSKDGEVVVIHDETVDRTITCQTNCRLAPKTASNRTDMDPVY